MSTPFTADVLVIGSGIAGALIAARLAQKGLKVTIMEAGASVDRAQAVQTFGKALVKVPESAYPPVPQAMHPLTHKLSDWYQQSGPDLFKSTYLKVVGGTTWHWLGTCLRLLPSDFALHTRFGRGVDWPITYADLEPFYGQAEQEIGVAGDASEDFGSPRSGGYPMARVPPSYLDTVVGDALKDSPYQVRSTPQARNSEYRDQRMACCGSASCIPVCPVQAKYDATVHLSKALAAGALLLERTTAIHLDVGPDGDVSSVRFRRWDESEGVLSARVVVLACNAIETPRLLLSSKQSRAPHGVANGSDQVGRNLMDHPVQLSWALSKVPVYPYRGPLSTSGIENLRDGEFRKERSAFRIEIGNDGWSWPTGAPASTAEALAQNGQHGLAHEKCHGRCRFPAYAGCLVDGARTGSRQPRDIGSACPGYVWDTTAEDLLSPQPVCERWNGAGATCSHRYFHAPSGYRTSTRRKPLWRRSHHGYNPHGSKPHHIGG